MGAPYEQTIVFGFADTVYRRGRRFPACKEATMKWMVIAVAIFALLADVGTATAQTKSKTKQSGWQGPYVERNVSRSRSRRMNQRGPMDIIHYPQSSGHPDRPPGIALVSADRPGSGGQSAVLTTCESVKGSFSAGACRRQLPPAASRGRSRSWEARTSPSGTRSSMSWPS